MTCKRIKKDQSIGQSIQYTLLSAFDEKFFSDITIKSCDGFSVSLASVTRITFLISSLDFLVRSSLANSPTQRLRLQQPQSEPDVVDHLHNPTDATAIEFPLATDHSLEHFQLLTQLCQPHLELLQLSDVVEGLHLPPYGAVGQLQERANIVVRLTPQQSPG